MFALRNIWKRSNIRLGGIAYKNKKSPLNRAGFVF
jgi:hypothetical protein